MAAAAGEFDWTDASDPSLQLSDSQPWRHRPSAWCEHAHDSGFVCFGCCPHNPEGLARPGPTGVSGLRFFDLPRDDPLAAKSMRAEWRPTANHCGFAGVVQGGLVSVVFDCLAEWLCVMSHGRLGGCGRRAARTPL
jgi:hypothetical protein